MADAGLDLLRAVGWLVLHDVAVPGSVDQQIDHIVAGPSGVYVINSIGGTGSVRTTDNTLIVAGASQTEHVTEIAAAALALREAMGGHPVVPILCFRRAGEVAGVVSKVAVCSTENILELLNGQPKVFDAVATSEVMQKLIASVERRSVARPVVTIDEAPPEEKPRHRQKVRTRKRLLPGFGRSSGTPEVERVLAVVPEVVAPPVVEEVAPTSVVEEVAQQPSRNLVTQPETLVVDEPVLKRIPTEPARVKRPVEPVVVKAEPVPVIEEVAPTPVVEEVVPAPVVEEVAKQPSRNLVPEVAVEPQLEAVVEEEPDVPGFEARVGVLAPEPAVVEPETYMRPVVAQTRRQVEPVWKSTPASRTQVEETRPTTPPIGEAARRVDRKSAIKMVTAAFARRDEQPEFELAELETAFAEKAPPRAVPAWFGAQTPSPVKVAEAVPVGEPKKRRRATLMPAIVGAAVIAVIFGIGPRVPDAYDWGKSFFVDPPPPNLGQATVIAATGGHPAVRVLAGVPLMVKSIGVSASKGQHLVGVPVQTLIQGTKHWTMPIAGGFKVVDSLGIEHVPATKVTKVNIGKVLPSRLSLSPGKQVTGMVIFAIPDGREISTVKLTLNSVDPASIWNSADPK